MSKLIPYFLFPGKMYLIFAFSSVGSHKLLLANCVGSFVKWFLFNSLGLEKIRLIVRQCFDLIINIFHITVNCMSVNMIIFWITWVHFSWFYFWSAIFWNHIHLFNVYWYLAFSFEATFLFIFPSSPVAGWVSIEV